jgi:hypothetical protein
MKITAITALSSKGSHLAFAFACALIAGVGWCAKIGVNQIGSVHDDISAGFNHPSPAYLRYEWHRSNPPATQQHSAPYEFLLPTNAPPLVLP